jgi:hypothetical protein
LSGFSWPRAKVSLGRKANLKISQVSTRLMPAVTTWRQIPSSARCVALSVISAATAAAGTA